jgi:hypothetical protein
LKKKIITRPCGGLFIWDFQTDMISHTVKNFLKKSLSILLLFVFGLTGVIYSSPKGKIIKNAEWGDFSNIVQIDNNFDLVPTLRVQIDITGSLKSKQPDYQFDFYALAGTQNSAGIFSDLAFTIWQKNFPLFFDVFQLLFPFHHFW